MSLFSKRGKELPNVFQTQVIPERLRRQVFHIWEVSFMRFGHGDRIRGYTNKYMQNLHQILCRENGEMYLHDQDTPEIDLQRALLHSGNHQLVMDIIELSFRLIMQLEEGIFCDEQKLQCVDDLNRFFKENGVGFQFDWRSQSIIPMNAPLIHEEAVRPALALLAHTDFATANKEMLEAWDDFKKSDFDDCLLKCGKAFESVMKIICTKKNWQPQHKGAAIPIQTAQAQQLLDAIIAGARMEPFFSSPLILIATLRNKLSAHGGGTATVHVPEHYARYALNATASAIVLLVEATGV